MAEKHDLLISWTPGIITLEPVRSLDVIKIDLMSYRSSSSFASRCFAAISCRP